jgi:hypothetical protein
MDPTPNPKLKAITKALEDNGGRVFLGDEVWSHLSELSGVEIATFVKRYIKDPVESIAIQERELLDLGLRYRTGIEGDIVEVTIGTHSWVIRRPRRDEAVAIDDERYPYAEHRLPWLMSGADTLPIIGDGRAVCVHKASGGHKCVRTSAESFVA